MSSEGERPPRDEILRTGRRDKKDVQEGQEGLHRDPGFSTVRPEDIVYYLEVA